ncbi:hypothetical protein [Elioraea tepidiphila]|jgi:hypothetical protein|uniref:hypothetical protein n=1 Tax=Elioraea TaxID=457933 RepID=UPI0003664773|nr:hypothetical protein [Elioraea tepidiphila]
MAKASIFILIALTVVIAWAMKRRQAPVKGGVVAKKKAAIRLWFDAAAIAVGITLVLLAAMHWLRLGWA